MSKPQMAAKLTSISSVHVSIALWLLLAAAGPLHAQPGVMLDGRAWRIGHDASDATQRVAEFVLPDETVDEWTELVTSQVFLVSSAVSLDSVLNAIRGGFGSDCRAFQWKVRASSESAALFEWSHQGCSGDPAQYELSHLRKCARGLCRWAYTTKRVPPAKSQTMKWTAILTSLPDEAPRKPMAGAQTRLLRLASGETISHRFRDGMPEPARSASFVFNGAGPSFASEIGGERLSWVVDLVPSTDRTALVLPNRIVVEEISGKRALLFDGPPADASAQRTIVIAPGELVSNAVYPWLYTDDDTVLILRVSVYRPTRETEILTQPIVIDSETKLRLRQARRVK